MRKACSYAGMGNSQSSSDQDCWKIMLAESPTILSRENCECVRPKKMLQLKRNKNPQSPSPNQRILMFVTLVLSSARPSNCKMYLATKVALDFMASFKSLLNCLACSRQHC